MLLSNSHTNRSLMATIRYSKVNAKPGKGLPPFSHIQASVTPTRYGRRQEGQGGAYSKFSSKGFADFHREADTLWPQGSQISSKLELRGRKWAEASKTRLFLGCRP